jgi:hypothetical protein
MLYSIQRHPYNLSLLISREKGLKKSNLWQTHWVSLVLLICNFNSVWSWTLKFPECFKILFYFIHCLERCKSEKKDPWRTGNLASFPPLTPPPRSKRFDLIKQLWENSQTSICLWGLCPFRDLVWFHPPRASRCPLEAWLLRSLPILSRIRQWRVHTILKQTQTLWMPQSHRIIHYQILFIVYLSSERWRQNR